MIAHQCRRFLDEPQGSVNIKAWRVRFVVLDFLFGVAWMFNVVTVVNGHADAGTFMLFVMLLVVAVSSMLASSLPIAVFAATVPVTTAVVFDFILKGDIHSYILVGDGGDRPGLFRAARRSAFIRPRSPLWKRAPKRTR